MIQKFLQLLARYPFLSCFFIGTVFIVLLRLIVPGKDGAVLAVLVAIAAIFLLGNYYYRSGVKDLIRAGDELYYLGLLFTLVSLSYALISLFNIDPNAVDAIALEKRTNDLIGSFGIALGSTIAGIIARILLQSIGDSTDKFTRFDKERALAANLDTDEDILFLRAKLREASDAFSHFTRITVNQAEQTSIHTEYLIKEFNTRMNSHLESELDKAITAWSDSIQEMSEQSQQVISTIAQHAQDTFESSGKNWQALSENVKTTSQGIQTQFNTSMDTLSKMLEHIHAASHSLNDLTGSLNTTAQGVASLGHTVSEASSRFNSSSDEIIDGYETLKRNSQQLHGVVQGAGENIQGSMSTLLNGINSINHSLNDIAKNLDTTEQHTGQIKNNAENTALELNEHAEQIVKTYEVIRRGSQEQEEVQRHISETLGLVKTLATHISKLILSIEQQKSSPFRFWKN